MWYDWGDTLTYDADVTMVVGARNLGKTFGLREQMLRDWIKRGERFVAVTRYKDAIGDVAAGYFDAVLTDTRDKTVSEWRDAKRPSFRTSRGSYLVRYDGDKEWQCIGYLVHLSVRQAAKERTFSCVRRVVMDECIIEPADRRYRHYLADEWGNLASVMTSCGKGRIEGHHAPQAYLLANAVDLINPWFRAMRIYDAPRRGKSWHKVGDVRVLLDYVEPSGEASQDVGARMVSGSQDESGAWGNAFVVDRDTLIEEKPRSARYQCGFVWRGRTFGVWPDTRKGLIYVTRKFAIDSGMPMYALTTEDNRINYLTAKPARKALASVADSYGYGIVRFDSPQTRDDFARVLREFGIR